MPAATTTPLDAVFAALSDRTRRAILARLARGETSVTELARPFDMTLPAVTKHLRVLEGAGLVVREKTGRTNWCRLRVEPLQAAAEWMDGYRRFWTDQLDARDRYLRRRAEEEEPWPKPPATTTRRSASRASSTRRASASSGPGRTRRR